MPPAMTYASFWRCCMSWWMKTEISDYACLSFESHVVCKATSGCAAWVEVLLTISHHVAMVSITISSFPFLHFFMSLAIWAPPDSSLLTTCVSWPSTVFFYLLIICSTTFPCILSLVLLISSTTFFFLLCCSLDYIMDSRPGYINPQSNPCIP